MQKHHEITNATEQCIHVVRKVMQFPFFSHVRTIKLKSLLIMFLIMKLHNHVQFLNKDCYNVGLFLKVRIILTLILYYYQHATSKYHFSQNTKAKPKIIILFYVISVETLILHSLLTAWKYKKNTHKVM